MATECWYCGGDDHYASACRNRDGNAQPKSGSEGDGKPPWCGQCNPRTRLVDHGSYMDRCIRCHPLASRPLSQHRRCGCGQFIYVFDDLPCGKHQPLNISPGGHRAALTRKDPP